MATRGQSMREQSVRLGGSRHGGRATLLGRRSECAALDALVDALVDASPSGASPIDASPAEAGRVLVVTGAPGVGKSALLDYAVTSAAPDVRVVRAVGVETERDLAYAALHQLCGPLLDRLPALPTPQRNALEIVFGSRDGPSPDRFVVGLAVLGLLVEASHEGPVLAVVDDAQWLDPASAQVLGFVGRRLRSEPIALVLGAREPGEHLFGLPELEIPGLRDQDALILLDSVTRSWRDDEIRERIVAEADGNPLALLEFSRGVTVTQLVGDVGLGRAGDRPGPVERGLLTRIQELPTPARLLLLVAAAEPVGDPTLVWRAAERLGVPPATALAEPLDGLLSLADRVTFRHPLARSAVYRAAAPPDRRAAHRALAEVTDGRVDADRRAWHLAAATTGPDERVAAELERCAGQARSRGGLAGAAAFLQRALALTQDPTRRADRALAAAEASLRAGDVDAARRYHDAAERDARDERQRARAGGLRGQLAFACGRVDDAWPLLLDAAGRLERSDQDRGRYAARRAYVLAWGAAATAGDAAALLAVCRAAGALAAPTAPARPLDVLLDGLVLLGTGARAAAVPHLRRAAAAMQRLDRADDDGADDRADDDVTWGWVAAAVAPVTWDDELTLALGTQQLQLAREAGAVPELALHLDAVGLAVARTGDLPAAGGLAAEAALVADLTGAPASAGAALHRAALQGRETEASAVIVAASDREHRNAALVHWTAAVLLNGLARYEEALAAARASSRLADPVISAWALPELVEAACRTGDQDAAEDALEHLRDATKGCDTPWALGVAARCRALLSHGAEADELYREAIERLARTGLRPELARAQLLHGEWLRRQGRRVEARDQLRSARTAFGAMGLEAFAERARRELLATGETLRRRTVAATATTDLTPQQQRIATLVRDGLSNPEVGARLFLSPRTVEWHLRQIFTKLSITSRRQLRDVLPRAHDDLVTDQP